MKYVIVVLIVLSSVFVSCDGRKNHNEALKEAISEFNKKSEQIDHISYFPKEYVEIVTDTIIENTFKIHIKNHTLMDESVIISSQDNPHKIEYQRSFESEISVYNASGALFKTLINAKTFTGRDYNLFWENATLQHVWVNQEESDRRTLRIAISFVNPKFKSYKLYQMVIDENGICKTSLKEEYI